MFIFVDWCRSCNPEAHKRIMSASWGGGDAISWPRPCECEKTKNNEIGEEEE